MTSPTTTRLAYLRDGNLELTPLPGLPDGGECQPCGEDDAVLRVYGHDLYVEACAECGPWAVSIALREQPDTAGPVRVEVAADVWATRDDTGDC